MGYFNNIKTLEKPIEPNMQNTYLQYINKERFQKN